MFWTSITELSLSFGLILIILYGLFSLSVVDSEQNKQVNSLDRTSSLHLVNLNLQDVYLFSQLWPFMILLGFWVDFPLFSSGTTFIESLALSFAFPYNNGIDFLLIILTFIIMQSFKSFESVLLLLLAFVGQYFMLHSCDLLTFYISLEAQNFCFLVLCALQPRTFKPNMERGTRPLAGVEASIKYLLLSAFSSGVLLYWFSLLYLRTGLSSLTWGPLSISVNDVFQNDSVTDVIPQMLILIALMFKLGAAPLHIWMIDIYSGVKRQLLMVLSTAPKLSLFGFWVSTWHSVWTDLTILVFVAMSMIIGCLGAYNQPSLRALFAYSTVNEIGLMLMAIETAGFHSLFQHLTIYIVTMLLLWNQSDKRLFTILAVSLAGLPPLAGFFGKAWIFNSVATTALSGPYLGVLVISLFCTGLSLVYYLRVFRLFTMNQYASNSNVIMPSGMDSTVSMSYSMNCNTRINTVYNVSVNSQLTSFCAIFLMFAPLFYLKPFVL